MFLKWFKFKWCKSFPKEAVGQWEPTGSGNPGNRRWEVHEKWENGDEKIPKVAEVGEIGNISATLHKCNNY